ncbi:hypothetical protein HJFPF1_03200 [Paramyrothecium foliicola]|nr:hypothetical protein HJFPF1_03200 [Paramyrothecium foliicola]
MSTNAHKANLARIRDNQRRSRARRREYVHELEQRLRSCELQGVEASAEVQAAARKVADENRRLRSLLNKHGVGDDLITQYLHAGTVLTPNYPANPMLPGVGLGTAVQSLQNVIVPRRPSCLDTNVVYSVPRKTSGEDSAVGVATPSSSTSWEPAQLGTPVSQSHTPQPCNIPPTPVSLSTPQQHHLHIYTENSTPRSQPMTSQQAVISPEDGYQHNYTVQPVLFNHQAMAYGLPLSYQPNPDLQYQNQPNNS